MKICPTCKKEFNDEQAFCGECGTKLEVKHTSCPKCGYEVNPDQQFCGNCGTKLNSNSSTFNADKIAAELLSKTEKVTRLASAKTKELLSDKNVEEVKKQLTSNAEEARKKISAVAQNIQSGELSFDLIKMFPTSESQYDAYIKFMLIPIIASIFIANIHALHEMTDIIPDSIFFISEVLNVAIFIFVIYVMGYIFVKANIHKYIIKLVLGLVLSIFINIIIPIIPILISLYINRKRKDYLKKYKRYIFYPLTVCFISGLLTLVAYCLFYFNFISSIVPRTLESYHNLTFSSDSIIFMLIIHITLITALGSIFGFFAMRRFMRKEQAKGISFLKMSRLQFVVPATAIFYILSFLTIFHFFDISPDDVIVDGATADIDPTTNANLTQNAAVHFTNNNYSETTANVTTLSDSITNQFNKTELLQTNTPTQQAPDNITNIQTTKFNGTAANTELTANVNLTQNVEHFTNNNYPETIMTSTFNSINDHMTQEITQHKNVESYLENVSPNSKIDSTTPTQIDQIVVKNSHDNPLAKMKDAIVLDNTGKQIGSIGVEGKEIVLKDMQGMPIASTDGQFNYDGEHKPTFIVDKNSTTTTLYSENETIYKHGNDILDAKTGKPVPVKHIDKVIKTDENVGHID